MEIAPVPQRRVWTTRAWLAIVVILFAPVTLLTLLPTMFGLERYVMSSDEMTGSLDRGSVVLERVVPVSDLEIGDVVTYEAPAGSDHTGLVTHRIIDIKPGAVRTQSDDPSDNHPVDVVPTNERPTMSRVVFAIPYVGLPFLLSVGTWVWLAVLVAAGGTLTAFLLPAWRRRHARRASSRVGEFAR